ncbi:hypothetical protein DFH07DRAFT_829533 [Mycena maculata]|uniref:Uncharacterized protein n=1 Tax=Mycena maculata TaxID=230809 RepID=A0AAD7ITG9_9AGAR|nr:hypothetical protein DFH07DRAFT_829533 [Mycena maculata]
MKKRQTSCVSASLLSLPSLPYVLPLRVVVLLRCLDSLCSTRGRPCWPQGTPLRGSCVVFLPVVRARKVALHAPTRSMFVSALARPSCSGEVHEVEETRKPWNALEYNEDFYRR